MSSDNERELVELLDMCTPGNLPSAVFDAVARVTVYPAIELVPYRYRDGVLEVGFLRRSVDDPFWPSMWHIPGTVLRPTDRSLDDGFDRLFRDELLLKGLNRPEFFSFNIVPYVRGSGLTLEHAIDFTSIPHDGGLTFFNITTLPEGFIKEQEPIVRRLQSYLHSKRG